MDRILVANRGEIARRIMRTCDAMGISTVAVYSDADRLAPHVGDADLAVPLGGQSSAESYLDMDKILDAASRSGAQAVHPGYGFLAENAEFAERCMAAGLTWIGPPPSAIRAMALKVEAKALAAAAGVPLLPGATLEGDDEQEWSLRAETVGYPLLVKASAGGGGKGMRLVEGAAELVGAIAGARREAMSSFGDATVFLERYLTSPRHVEVQVMADRHGHVVHLLDRDCSLQRRHQKVVEEAPAPNLAPDLRARMHDAALALTRSIGYEGAGTLEFLVAGEEFFFLEMNTRLQVEHPVTEEITGLDLVRAQIEIAAGAPLPFTQEMVDQRGHAIEARLYAEDPARDFLPSIGRLLEIEPSVGDGIGDGIRYEIGVRSGSEVSPHYDPMLAKVIAWAGTRAEAAHRLARALRRLRVAGLRTNREFLVATLESSAFLDARLSTAFFSEHPEVLSPPIPSDVASHAAVALAHVLRQRDGSDLLAPSVVPPGWRSLPALPQTWRFQLADDRDIEVALPPPGSRQTTASVDGTDVECTVVTATTPEKLSQNSREGEGRGSSLTNSLPRSHPGDWTSRRLLPPGNSFATASDTGASEIDLVVGGIRRRFHVTSHGDSHFLASKEWQVELQEHPRFPSSANEGGPSGTTSPLPGTIVAVAVEPGDQVQEGDLLVVLEAMKMEHRIVADMLGIVGEVLVSVGQRVDAHQPLITVFRDDEEVQAHDAG